MVLIYGKSLFVNQQYIATFELFQHQYSLYTHLPALLYHYGRYVAMAKNEKFYGSALTAFEECLRSQLYVRRGDVLVNIILFFHFFLVLDGSYLYREERNNQSWHLI
jgi:hypothetical protein